MGSSPSRATKENMFDEQMLERLTKDKQEKLKTSYGRFLHRQDLWREHGYKDLWAANRAEHKTPYGKAKRARELKLLEYKLFLAKAQHYFWWFVHNCIAHPMIGVVPVKTTFRFHDYTFDKINLK